MTMALLSEILSVCIVCCDPNSFKVFAFLDKWEEERELINRSITPCPACLAWV